MKEQNLLKSTGVGTAPIIPLQMEWQPKPDITTYELALCMPYLIPNTPYGIRVMPYSIDRSLEHFRHFKITDHNK